MSIKLKVSFSQWIWLVGDLLVLLVVTLFGFASHNTMSVAGSRLWATWLPWAAGWLLVAPHVGAFDRQYMKDAGQLWRPFWAMVLASPMGGMLRGFWLGSSVTPIFIVVFGGVAALAVTGWRAAFWALFIRRNPANAR